MRKRILSTILALVSAAALCFFTACSDPAAPPLQDVGENNTGNTGNEGGNVTTMPVAPEEVVEIFETTYAAEGFSAIATGDSTYIMDFSDRAEAMGYDEGTEVICEMKSGGEYDFEFDLQEGIYYQVGNTFNATAYYVDGELDEARQSRSEYGNTTCIMYDGEYGTAFSKEQDNSWRLNSYKIYESNDAYLEAVMLAAFPYTNTDVFKSKKEGGERGYLSDMVSDFVIDSEGNYVAELYMCGGSTENEIYMDAIVTLTVENNLITSIGFLVEGEDVEFGTGGEHYKTVSYDIKQTIEYVAPELTIKKTENAQSYQSLLTLFAAGKNEWEAQNSAR